jgi:hypothetical protein
MDVMRCTECRELFEAHLAALVKERPKGPSSDLILCPVCKLRAMQRGVSAPQAAAREA